MANLRFRAAKKAIVSILGEWQQSSSRLTRLRTLVLCPLTIAMSAALAPCIRAQDAVPTPAPDSANLTGLTTPVETQFADGRKLQGSGFFYLEFAPETEKKEGPHWVAISHTYLVTAKHVIQPKRMKDIVKFSFAIRVGDQQRVEWHRLDLGPNELGRRLHLCQDEVVDVAVVDVTDQLSAELTNLLKQRAL